MNLFRVRHTHTKDTRRSWALTSTSSLAKVEIWAAWLNAEWTLNTKEMWKDWRSRFLFVLLFIFSSWHSRNSLTKPFWSLCSLQWKCKVLTTGPSEKSHMVSWLLTRILGPFSVERIVSSANSAGTTGEPHGKERSLAHTSQHTHKEVNSKWIKDLNVRPKII